MHDVLLILSLHALFSKRRHYSVVLWRARQEIAWLLSGNKSTRIKTFLFQTKLIEAFSLVPQTSPPTVAVVFVNEVVGNGHHTDEF